MHGLTGTRILGIALMVAAAVALAGCGGGKRRSVTTTTVVTTTAPTAAPAVISSGIAGDDAAKRRAPSAGGTAVPDERDHGQTGGHLLAGGVGFGVLSQGIVDAGLAGGAVASGSATGAAAGLAGASGQQCQNPFGTQPAANGQLICSAQEERLQCQCDANGCQLVPTGIRACLPVGAVYQ